MNVKIPVLCRGENKNFFLVRAADAPKNAMFSARVTSVESPEDELPFLMFPVSNQGESAAVLVLPDLPGKDLKFTFSWKDAQGAVIDEITQSMTYSFIKWKSRLSYRAHADVSTQIRDVDTRGKQAWASIEFLTCIQDADKGEDVVRFKVKLRNTERTLTPEWLEENGRPYAHTTYSMGGNVLVSGRSSDDFDREYIFSTRMKRAQVTLLLAVKDAVTAELVTFAVYDQGTHDELLGRYFDETRNAEQDPFYAEWFSKHRADQAALDYQRTVQFDEAPLLSVVVPLYKTPLDLFTQMVDSVSVQSYQTWELVLVNASPEDANLSRRAQQYADSDSRIKVATLSENKGIAENTNAGIAAAAGDFIGFLDHDDVIEPNTFYEYVYAINQKPETDVLYCDEDKLLPDGSYANPYFKGTFNPDLLRSNNYVCHFLMIKRELLNQILPMKSDFDGAQDYDLILHASELAQYVNHVPRLLYHWRITENSTAYSAATKSYAQDAGLRALQCHLDRMGIKGTVESASRPFNYRIRYEMPNPAPLVSIIIPSKDHQSVLKTCVDSIREKSTYTNFELIIVDNQSTQDETFAYYDELKRSTDFLVSVVSYPKSFNFSAMMNLGARSAHGDYLLLLNNDTEVITPEWMEEMLGFCLRKEVGAVGARLFYPDDTIQHAGVFFAETTAWHNYLNLPRGYWGYHNLADSPQDVSGVTAACLMVRKECFEQVGGFDEEMAVEYNDVDFCLKLRRAGYLNVYTPFAELTHYESLSRGNNNKLEQLVRSRKEISLLGLHWAEELTMGDPYLNPNLSPSIRKCIYRAF